MYIADAHIYLLAARDEAFRNELTNFAREHGPLLVSAVVVAEVLVAVPDAASDAALVRGVEAGAPMLAPTEDDWVAAARAIARLGGAAVTKGRSFWNDALLAAQCARLSATLITDNEADYRRLRTHLGVRTARPFPD